MSSLRFRSRRIAAAALAAGLALSTLGVGGASAATTTDPGKAAAGWIAAQVEAGGLGQGSLADAIFAFAAVKAGHDASDDALDQLEASVDEYILDGSNVRAGALGKVLLAVIVAGGNEHSFGGHDLEAMLRSVMETTGADVGHFTGASMFDQSLDVLALAATSGGAPADSGDWLASKQCASGEYSWDGSCPAGPGSEDPDTTGIALQALLASNEDAAADKAVDWLVALQDSDGAFPAYGTPNTNSTGLAGQGLRAAGRTAAADMGAAFVTALQYGCGTSPASDIGAIAWAQIAAGVLILSTPQAVLTMGAGPLNELSISGATADAPTLDCPVAPTPRPSNGGGGDPAPTPTHGGNGGGQGASTITPPPTDVIHAELPDAAASPALGLIVVLLVTAGASGLAISRRSGGRP
jgi:hypothetical protein